MSAKKRASGRSVPEAQRHTARLVLRLPPDVAARIRAEAAREGITISAWVVNRAGGSSSHWGKERWIMGWIEMPKPTPQHVGSTRVGGFWVSTMRTMGHVWETMAFPCDESGTVTDWGEVYCDRYATEEGAKAGHSLACDVMAERVANGRRVTCRV